VSAEHAIRIRRATPQIAYAGADLLVKVSIAVYVMCDGPEFYQSSAWTLNGAEALICPLCTVARFTSSEVRPGRHPTSMAEERARDLVHVRRIGTERS